MEQAEPSVEVIDHSCILTLQSMLEWEKNYINGWAPNNWCPNYGFGGDSSETLGQQGNQSSQS